MSSDPCLIIARALLVLGTLLGLAGLGGGVLLVAAYVHDRVRRLGWPGLLARLFHP
jgi:hypothetical protein